MKLNQLSMAVFIGFSLAACGNLAESDSQDKDSAIVNSKVGFNAQITRTKYGVAHIKANDLRGLGFGNAYAQAQDNICLMADNYIRVRGERAKYFGPDKKVEGDGVSVIEDFGYRVLGLHEKAKSSWSKLSHDSQALIEGFVSGYNLYLDYVNAGKFQLPEMCAEKEWVKPIEKYDVLAYLFGVAVFPGAGAMLEDFHSAQPNAELNSKIKHSGAYYAGLEKVASVSTALGSNGWAIGKDLSQHGGGMVLANPHFPYTGELRFWQSHAKVADQIDVMGASLIGFPGVINIGFNQNLAWTHTYSEAEHMVLYRMTTVDGDKMHYEVDGEAKPITVKPITIEVKTDDGTIKYERNAYFTEVGPVLVNEDLPWTDDSFFVVKDVNDTNLDLLDHWLALNRADSIEEAEAAFKQYNGVVFNNTLLSDANGQALYIDDSTVPNLSDMAIELLKNNEELSAIRKEYGVTVLPGHISDLIFSNAVPYESAPQLKTTSFVQNSNNSHWATNPNTLLENFSPLYGTEREPLSLRTRMGLKLIDEMTSDGDKLTLAEIEQAMTTDRALLPEIALSSINSMCGHLNGPVQLNDAISVDLKEACQLMASWDGRYTPDSKASLIMREFAFILEKDTMFATAFDPAQPAITPSNLKTDENVLRAFGYTVFNLQNVGFELGKELREVQFVERTNPDGNGSGNKISWPGALEAEGGFNLVSVWSWDNTYFKNHHHNYLLDTLSEEYFDSGLTDQGYHIRYGSSFMMAVELNKSGPVARGLLTYSQSTQKESQHYADQTQFYAEKNTLLPLYFTDTEIKANQISTVSISK
ncbi:acyl-homoserine-lactone acylase [Pseudoalteromonas ulvae UL12]|uniref:acylase n=1 Tax=Pseudoalteromonas ulvae TaxID=107327 RepID=UPI00186B648C|nr:acylase [Pseudoalteromonas ulvae]MBE0362177.1 acyl-homoserine-lactone acylase [Pseudoalteromonas ulvae UL12]